jgi:hypothetical protein
MFFRPEEMDATSGIGPVLCPLMQWDIDISVHSGRSLVFNDSIAHYHEHGFATIQTGSVNLNRLTRKHPADRQGFEPSLREPFLVSVDSNTVLRRQVIKGCKGSDQVCIGV